MLGVSGWEFVIILGVALLVIGPDQVSSLFKMLGRGIGYFSRTWLKFKKDFNEIFKEIDKDK